MKNSNIFLGIALAMVAGLTACSNDDNLTSQSSREPIAFSSFISNKAVVTTKTRALGEETYFAEKTQIVMSIKSDKNGSTETKKAANTSAYVAAKESSATNVKTAVTFTDTETRYWDDLFGRDALLTVYAAGVEGKTIANIAETVSGRTNNKLELDANNKIAWNLSTSQTESTYKVEDLLISNNNKNAGAGNDNRLKYQNYAFDKGNLLFKHAMTKITINLKKGDGFAEGEFANPTVTYNGFYSSATVNAADGSVELPAGATTTNISPIKQATANEGYNYTYNALVIPSRNWDATDNQTTFTIATDNNTYVVNTKDFNTSSSITNKLTGAMAAGNQYIFNVTINKSGIVVTASLFDWIPNNTAVTPVIVKGSGIGHNFEKDNVTYFDMYRSMSIGQDYNGKETTIEYTTAGGFQMEPQIYWPNHEDAYYFRAIAQLNEDGTICKENLPQYTKEEGENKPNYIDIKTCKTVGSGPTATKKKDGKDVIVGAPYEKNSDGTVGNLTEAKKAEDGDINFTFKHVLSEVYVQLKTTEGADQVDLTNAKVEILNSYTEGKVMSETNTFAELSGDKTDAYSLGSKYTGTVTDPIKLPGGETATDNVFRGYTIPQSLYTSDTDKVQIKVTTSDGNTYFVDCKTSDIASWKEGNQYLYNLTLKKTGVVLTASLVDWITGKTINIGVQL